jgi:pimeloyl-ACP methyl ester carboxylesterase
MPNEWPILLVRHMRFAFEGSAMTHVLPREAVAGLRIPVLTVHGTRDRNAPYGAGREWAFVLPEGRLLSIPGAAHQAFAEHPETVMPAVKEFLAGRWPKAAEKVARDPRVGP